MISILNNIPVGEQNAISREKLCAVTGLNDRSVRNNIALLRNDFVILYSINHGGYFRPDREDVLKVKAFVNMEKRRAASILNGIDKAIELINITEREAVI